MDAEDERERERERERDRERIDHVMKLQKLFHERKPQKTC
jgi:hypothetical protein